MEVGILFAGTPLWSPHTLQSLKGWNISYLVLQGKWCFLSFVLSCNKYSHFLLSFFFFEKMNECESSLPHYWCRVSRLAGQQAHRFCSLTSHVNAGRWGLQQQVTTASWFLFFVFNEFLQGIKLRFLISPALHLICLKFFWIMQMKVPMLYIVSTAC